MGTKKQQLHILLGEDQRKKIEVLSTKWKEGLSSAIRRVIDEYKEDKSNE
jgi:hypothetical protein